MGTRSQMWRLHNILNEEPSARVLLPASFNTKLVLRLQSIA
jgi:hypothetical protein